MFIKKQKLMVEQKEKLEQIDILNKQIEKLQKEYQKCQEKLNNSENKLNNFYQSNNNFKNKELTATNNKKQILLSETKEKISKLQKKLSAVSRVVIKNAKTLKELAILQREKSDKLNINLVDINDKIKITQAKKADLILKINEKQSSALNSCSDDFKIEVQKLPESEDLFLFDEKEMPLLEGSDARDSGIDIEEITKMIM